MATTKKKVAGTINCTPTWESAARIYLMVLENGNDEGKKIAREEIIRLSKGYDELLKAYNSLSHE